MSRKDKKSELKSWVSSLKGYIVSVEFEAYSFNAIVLADNEPDAEAIAKNEYPGAKSYTLTNAANRILA
jgi:hypothetical protein